MENFADQCLDMAQSILGHNLESITEQGTITPVSGEDGEWYPERPFTLASRLMERVCQD